MQIEPLGKLARTHTCGALRAEDVGKDVVLLGWVHRVRDLGSLVFIDIRDRHGVTQVIVRDNDALVADAKRLRAEFVIAVMGTGRASRARDGQQQDCDRADRGGGAREIRLLNEAKTPPFMISDDVEITEEARLKYRYIDLRRPRMQRNMIMRHRATMAIRNYFDEQGFLEIETPMLTKSTPEGARDYLVPSRVHPGEFYALPQSPQIFKQILMIAGMDRYFQIVKCFRDEDLRADRQPEFTQVDLEISFATEELVFATIEPLMERLMALIGQRRSAAVSASALRGGDREVRVRQARPALRHGNPQPVRRVCDVGILRVPQRDRDRRERCAGFPCRVRRSIRGASSTSWSNRRSSSARAGSCGRGARDGGVQSSALKAAGEEAIRRALDLAGAGPAISC